MAKKEDIRNLSDEELRSKIMDAREEMMNFRFQQTTGELSDFNSISFTRREIARMLTILREREIEAANGGQNE